MHVIEVDSLVKRYEKADRAAVDDVSFDVRSGEFFALLGPNGAGKTTTISILTTTLLPSSGRVSINGYDVEREPAQVRRHAGIIFQTPSLDLNLTAEENVRFHTVLYGLYPFRPAYSLMPAAYRKRVGELAEVLGLSEDIFKPVRGFSGGMKRKLEIVRSLVHRPRVLFLDEPTTGLDPSSRRALWRYLEDERHDSGTTLLLTTHYLDEAEQADRICIMSRGRVVSLGSPDEVKADLVERYLIVDSPDRQALAAELNARGIRWREHNGAVRIDVAPADVHAVLKSIDTPLSDVRTVAPTLEDAYLSIVERDEGVSAAVGLAEEHGPSGTLRDGAAATDSGADEVGSLDPDLDHDHDPGAAVTTPGHAEMLEKSS